MVASHSRPSKVTLNQPCLGLLGFGVFLAPMEKRRNSVLAWTTKQTPPAPREGLFWFIKHSTGLVSVKTGLLFLMDHPAAASCACSQNHAAPHNNHRTNLDTFMIRTTALNGTLSRLTAGLGVLLIVFRYLSLLARSCKSVPTHICFRYILL
jgi:hypothetical protein